MRIIEKYRHERKNDKIFNLYSRARLIQLTKKLGQAYGIDLTFHMARHNFGTHITLSLGVPLETVSRMMGHKRLVTTQIYAHVTDKKVDEDTKTITALAFRLKSEKAKVFRKWIVERATTPEIVWKIPTTDGAILN